MYNSKKRGIFSAPFLLSEVDRLTAEVYCIRGNTLLFSVSNAVKNLKHLITVLSNFQHTDENFFRHELLLVRVKYEQFIVLLSTWLNLGLTL